MSDAPQGPGWWQASDGKWYPPEQAPGAQPGADPGAGGPGGPYGTPATPGVGGEASATDAIGYGWKKFTENPGPIVIAALVGWVVFAVVAGIGYFVYAVVLGVGSGGTECDFNSAGNFVCNDTGAGFFTTFILGSLVLGFMMTLAGYLFQYFLIRIGLTVTEGRKVDTENLTSTDQLGPFVIASIVVSIAVGIGTILCYIPGLIVQFLTFFFGYFVVAKRMAPMDAIKASFELVKNNIGQVLIFWILAGIVMFIGALLCGIGLLVAMPVVVIAQAFMFKRLQGEPVAA